MSFIQPIPAVGVLTLNSDCYCVNTRLADSELVQYPDASCNIPCPGNVEEYCGGIIKFNTTDSSQRVTQVILLTFYANIVLLPSSTPTTSSTSNTTYTAGPILTSTASASIIYSVTTTNVVTVTAVTGIWCDLCHICPGYLTTRTTTITIPWTASGQDQENSKQSNVASIPMETVTKSCSCGAGGALSSLIVTVPHKSKIEALTEAANVIMASLVPGDATAVGPVYTATPSSIPSMNLPTQSVSSSVLPSIDQNTSVANRSDIVTTAPARPATTIATNTTSLLLPSTFTGGTMAMVLQGLTWNGLLLMIAVMSLVIFT